MLYAQPTLGNANTAAAPAASAQLAKVTLTAATAGPYKVVVSINITGTAETQLNNLRLRQNGVLVSVLPSVPGANQYVFERVDAAVGDLDVFVIANATAGSIYTTSVQATRLN
jgi:hypothetical protein